jgi:hypothetical protein
MKILAVLLGLCLVFVFVWERVDMVRVGYQIERLKHDKIVLERQRDELRVQFSALSASGRIARGDQRAGNEFTAARADYIGSVQAGQCSACGGCRCCASRSPSRQE